MDLDEILKISDFGSNSHQNMLIDTERINGNESFTNNMLKNPTSK